MLIKCIHCTSSKQNCPSCRSYRKHASSCKSAGTFWWTINIAWRRKQTYHKSAILYYYIAKKDHFNYPISFQHSTNIITDIRVPQKALYVLPTTTGHIFSSILLQLTRICFCQSCRSWRSRARADRPGWDHREGSILRAKLKTVTKCAKFCVFLFDE